MSKKSPVHVLLHPDAVQKYDFEQVSLNQVKVTEWNQSFAEDGTWRLEPTEFELCSRKQARQYWEGLMAHGYDQPLFLRVVGA